jgi:hypothetical protein
MKKHVIVITFLMLSLKLLKADLPPGWVVGWGRNINGQATGVPTETISNNSTGVVEIAGQLLNDVVAVSAGGAQGLALKSDGTILGWGANLAGQVVGSGAVIGNTSIGQVKVADCVLSNVTAVSAGHIISLACKSDGTVAFWGEFLDPNSSGNGLVSGLTNIITVSAGLNYGLAIREDRTVVSLERGDISGVKALTGLSNIVAVAAQRNDYTPSLALRDDGIVFRLPLVRGDQNNQIVASNAVKIAVGIHGHCLALQRDGTVYGWGENSSGESTGIPNRKAPYFSSGLVTANGQVLTNIIDIAAGSRFSVALKKDGTVVEWGRIDNTRSPAAVPEGLSNVVAIAAGEEFCLAITTNSAVAERFRQK